MKKIWLAIIGVVLLLGVVGLAGCGSNGVNGTLELKGNLYGQQEGIWVSGEGKVYATPDMAILTLGIESQETTVAEAQIKAAEAMSEVIAALKDSGVAEKDIQTRYFSIDKVVKWDDRTNEQIVTGFRVTNTVTAKVRDVEEAGAVIDAVVAAGGDLTRVDGISFTVEDPTPYYEQARAKAVADAKAKARQMADLTGVKLGRVTYTSESSYMPMNNYYSEKVLAIPSPTIDMGTSVSPGELEITTNIQIAYEIE